MDFINALAWLSIINIPASVAICLWMDKQVFGSDHRAPAWTVPAGIIGALWLVFG